VHGGIDKEAGLKSLFCFLTCTLFSLLHARTSTTTTMTVSIPYCTYLQRLRLVLFRPSSCYIDCTDFACTYIRFIFSSFYSNFASASACSRQRTTCSRSCRRRRSESEKEESKVVTYNAVCALSLSTNLTNSPLRIE